MGLLTGSKIARRKTEAAEEATEGNDSTWLQRRRPPKLAAAGGIKTERPITSLASGRTRLRTGASQPIREISKTP